MTTSTRRAWIRGGVAILGLGLIAMTGVVGMTPSSAVQANATLQCPTAGYERLWYPRPVGLSIDIPAGEHTVVLELLNANASVGAGFARVGTIMIAVPTEVCGETSGSLGVYTGPMRLDIVAEPVGEISVWARLSLIPIEVTTTTVPEETTTTTIPEETTTTVPEETTTTVPDEVTTTTGATPDDVTTTTAATPDDVTTTTRAAVADVTSTTEPLAEAAMEELPFTGDRTLVLALVGAGLLLGGAGLVLAMRRAHSSQR